MKKLAVFVSGKEHELRNERKIIDEVIKSLCFDAIDSENRPALNNLPPDFYIDEVQNSDIYIGVFAKEESNPSLKEFWTARKTQIPTLVFVKEVDERDPKLKEFLNEIEVKTYYRTFTDEVDLRKRVKDSLINLITDEFRKSQNLSEYLIIRKSN